MAGSVRFAAVLCALALTTPASSAGAIEHPVAGRKLILVDNDGQRRRLSFVALDPAIGPPFADPTTGSSSLIVRSSAGPGQCFAEIPLGATNWKPIRGDGPNKGYVYRDAGSGSQGIRRIALRPGRIQVVARGDSWPCDLGAEQQLPVSVELRMVGERYCSAFGGTVARNAGGRFRAGGAPAPAACPDADLTVADLNILHGLGCPGNCRQADRIDLLFQWIAARGCPDVVTMQEVLDLSTGSALPLIDARRATVCPFPYQEVFIRTFGIDEEMILSRYPVLESELHGLHGGFRHVLFARIDHPMGAVDVFTTHLASSSDGASNPCQAPCPAECVAAGASTIRECQAVQLAEYAAARHDVATPAVVTGDLNSHPDGFVYHQLADRGWTDVYRAAGNPECDPMTGVGCTSGRASDTLTQMESTDSNVDERIDYVFVVPPGPASACGASIDGPADDDGDGTATRLFADQPNPFATCGPAPLPMCWPSDHEGVELDLNCL